jgi:transposase
MIEISEILYRWVKGLKLKQIANSLGFSKNTVKRIVRQAEDLGLSLKDTTDKVKEISAAMSVERYSHHSFHATRFIVSCKLFN